MWPSQRPLQRLQKARVIGSKNQRCCRDCHSWYPHPHAQFSSFPVEATTVRLPRWPPPRKSMDFRGQMQRERSSVSICCGGCAFQRGSRLKLPQPQTDTTSVHCLSPLHHRRVRRTSGYVHKKFQTNCPGSPARIGSSDALLNRSAVIRVAVEANHSVTHRILGDRARENGGGWGGGVETEESQSLGRR